MHTIFFILTISKQEKMVEILYNVIKQILRFFYHTFFILLQEIINIQQNIYNINIFYWRLRLGEKKQDKVSLSFSKDKEVEQKLYKWVLRKGEIVGVSSIIKQILYEKMLEEEG